ncbi:hypothetical protein Tco_1161843, partial [Tanacetum coccineum]
ACDWVLTKTRVIDYFSVEKKPQKVQWNDITEINLHMASSISQGVAFLVEYLMNGKGFVGLAKLEHSLFGGLTIVCAAACFCLSIRLSAFIAISCCRVGLK